MPLVLALLSTTAQASDRLFAYTYQTAVLDQGQAELEPWLTHAFGREEAYTRLEHRLELELGLGGGLQTAFYFNHKSEAYEDPSGAVVLDSKFDGFSNEWKWQLTDPAADALGTGLYGELTLAPDETELEAKLLLDKQAGAALVALNLVGEAAREMGDDETEVEFKVLFGTTFEVSESFHLGVEAREVTELDEGEAELLLLSAGPSLAFRPEAGWIALTFLPQLTDLAHQGRNLDEAEAMETRLVVGLHL